MKHTFRAGVKCASPDEDLKELVGGRIATFCRMISVTLGGAKLCNQTLNTSLSTTRTAKRYPALNYLGQQHDRKERIKAPITLSWSPRDLCSEHLVSI